MTLTPADIASIGDSLTRWERVEYLAEFLVFAGCAGEIVPGKIACLSKHLKEGIEKWSSYLLLAALILSLIALLRTNTLSGSIVDSIGGVAKQAVADAGDAKGDAKAAATDATTAKGASAGAVTLATGARKEADSFEADIVSAKKQAADAESHLADALRQAAQAQEELNRLRTPRSLINTKDLIAKLKQFAGTEYTLNVSQDDESILFTKSLDEVLRAAGWVRKQPGFLTMGVTSITMFPGGIKESVPVCIGTGIQIHLKETMPMEELFKLPAEKVPKDVIIAISLQHALEPSVAPSDTRNVGDRVLVDGDLGNSPIIVCVGRKP